MKTVLICIIALLPMLAQSYLGVAYQTWNKPLGVWQSKEQIEYDFKKMNSLGVNSLRVELPWNVIEPKQDQFDYSKADLLFRLAKKYQMKLHIIIGFQWAPLWFENKDRAVFRPTKNQKGPVYSSLMNYTTEFARERYHKLLYNIASRYKGSKQLASWIIGNEFSYIDYINFKQVGYDEFTLDTFQKELKIKYKDVETFNKRFHTDFDSFKDIDPRKYPLNKATDTNHPIHREFFDFTRHKLSNFITLGCMAVKKADPKAKITYSSIGVLFSQFDHNYTSEDFHLISMKCKDNGRLDYFAINSYFNLNSTEAFHLGLSKKLVEAQTGTKTFFSEFGLTSSETYLEMTDKKQGQYLWSQFLENIFDEVPTPHVFTWADKQHVPPRERGFGLHSETRKEKEVFKYFKKMAKLNNEVDIEKLHSLISENHSQVYFLTPDENFGHIHYNSWLNENWILASLLERSGAKVDFIRFRKLITKKKSAIKLIVLTRHSTMSPESFKALIDWANTNKVNILSTTELPTSYHKENLNKRLKDFWKIENYTAKEDPKHFHTQNLSLYLRVKDQAAFTQFATWKTEEFKSSQNDKNPIKNFYYVARDTVNLFQKDKRSNLIYISDYKDIKLFHIPYAINYISEANIKGIQGFIYTLSQKHLYFSSDLVYVQNPRYLRPFDFLQYPLTEIMALSGVEILKTPASDILSHALYKKKNLKNSGELHFVTHLPKFQRQGNKECMNRSIKFHLNTKKRLVNLENYENLKPVKGKLKVNLKQCENLLLVDSKSFQKIKRKKKFKPRKITGANKLFFPRIALLNVPKCIEEKLKKIGYKKANLGTYFDNNKKDFNLEPDKGYYQIEKIDFEDIDRLYGFLIMPHDILTKDDLKKFKNTKVIEIRKNECNLKL